MSPAAVFTEAHRAAQALPQGALLCVVGARPNFMKAAPIVAALGQAREPVGLVHTGQHYDREMKDVFFAQLGMPEPDIDLEVGSGNHAVQTAEIMRRFEPLVASLRPAAVLVVGDVNSTIACALVAAKMGVPVVHIEAGLRSYDRSMPEEINRVLTDQLSELLFTTEPTARQNLLREGIAEERIHFVGNVMIDTMLVHKPEALPAAATIERHAGQAAAQTCAGGYAVLTLHRPSNVDEPAILTRLIEAIVDVSRRIAVVFAVHPRTAQALKAAGLGRRLQAGKVFCVPPLGYLEMLGLMAEARLVLTDSGGMQEETTVLGVPCVTLRENTERPITVEQGTNTVVGRDPARILAAVEDILSTGGKAGRIPERWDGQAAVRIRDILLEWLNGRRR